MRLRPPFFPGPSQSKVPPHASGRHPTGFDPLSYCASHFSTKSRGVHARVQLFRETRVEQCGAVFVDLDGAGFFKLLFAERPAGEDGDRPDTGPVRRLDVPDGVPHGYGLAGRGSGLLQGQLEDIGGGLGVLDVAGIDDAGDPALRLELLQVLLQFFRYRTWLRPPPGPARRYRGRAWSSRRRWN